MSRQLTFDLPVRPALGREDFFIAPSNALAVAALDGGNWPGSKMLLIGPEGAGKSHLAQVWAGTAGALVLDAEMLGSTLPDPDALVVENADSIAGDLAAETSLFHLHNHMQARATPLLLTARSAPAFWGMVLPDLASRLQATAIATLLPPDDALLSAVLVKLFADRQLDVPATLIPWLVTRMDRSFGAARHIVAALDAAALARGGPVTRTLAAELLDSAPDGAA